MLPKRNSGSERISGLIIAPHCLKQVVSMGVLIYSRKEEKFEHKQYGARHASVCGSGEALFSSSESVLILRLLPRFVSAVRYTAKLANGKVFEKKGQEVGQEFEFVIDEGENAVTRNQERQFWMGCNTSVFPVTSLIALCLILFHGHHCLHPDVFSHFPLRFHFIKREVDCNIHGPIPFGLHLRRHVSICAEHVIPGLDKAVLKMKKGETALVSVASEYGYGAQEYAGELAVVPPNSDLEYEVELVSFEKVRNRAPQSGRVLPAACSQKFDIADSGQLMRVSHRERQGHRVVGLIPVVDFGSFRPRSHGTWTAQRSWRRPGRGKRKAMRCISWGSMTEHRRSMPR